MYWQPLWLWSLLSTVFQRRYISLGVLLALLVSIEAAICASRRQPVQVEERAGYPVNRIVTVPLSVTYCDVFSLLWPYANGIPVEETVTVVTNDHSSPPALYVLFKGRTRYDKFIFPGLKVVTVGGEKEPYAIALK